MLWMHTSMNTEIQACCLDIWIGAKIVGIKFIQPKLCSEFIQINRIFIFRYGCEYSLLEHLARWIYFLKLHFLRAFCQDITLATIVFFFISTDWYIIMACMYFKILDIILSEFDFIEVVYVKVDCRVCFTSPDPGARK